MKLNPYLAFDGRCREAFEFYEKTLGGRISFMQTIGESPMASNMPAEAQGRIMHVTLQIGHQVLQGADAPPGQYTKPAGFCVATHFDDVAEGQRVFSALAQNGYRFIISEFVQVERVLAPRHQATATPSVP